MRNLITFLWKNYFFFLFVMLEVFAVFLMAKNNYYQRTVVINTTNDFTGSLLSVYDGLTDYFQLREANMQLAYENTQFHNRQPSSFIKTDTNVFYVDDTLHLRQFAFIPAQVISNSVNRRNNYLKLNKGNFHGVEVDMAVIAPNGVVGQIIETSENFCSVMSMLNMNTRISARLKSSGQVGTLRWDGNDYQIGKLLDIPSHVQIRRGDTVVTSGYSHIYPRGELIGVVEDYSIGEGDNFYQVDVRFSVDYNSLYHVYIVNNLLRQELMKLERKNRIQ